MTYLDTTEAELRYDSLLAAPESVRQGLRYRALQGQILAFHGKGFHRNADLVRETLVMRGISPISG